MSRFPDVRGLLSNEEGDQLTELVRSIPSGFCVVEIGAYMGLSTLCLSDDTPAPLVYSIDLWDSSPVEDVRRGGRAYSQLKTFELFKKNTAHLANSVYVKGDSGEIGKVWNRPIGVLFIDGAHDRASVERDFALFSPHVIPGGFVVFHDAEPGTKVGSFVEEIRDSSFNESWYVGQSRRMFVGVKRLPSSTTTITETAIGGSSNVEGGE